nr:unnamed protein product [Spirometra erinaceieuropaei]
MDPWKITKNPDVLRDLLRWQGNVHNGAISGAFAKTGGVEQGYVLASNLFGLMFSATLMGAYREEQPAIDTNHGADGRISYIRRLKASSKVSKVIVHDLLTVDDCALDATSEENMQRSVG